MEYRLIGPQQQTTHEIRSEDNMVINEHRHDTLPLRVEVKHI